MTIVNYASSSVNKLRASLNDDARVVIYDCRMLIEQATECRYAECSYAECLYAECRYAE